VLVWRRAVEVMPWCEMEVKLGLWVPEGVNLYKWSTDHIEKSLEANEHHKYCVVQGVMIGAIKDKPPMDVEGAKKEKVHGSK
jgi:hypothetical protein